MATDTERIDALEKRADAFDQHLNGLNNRFDPLSVTLLAHRDVIGDHQSRITKLEADESLEVVSTARRLWGKVAAFLPSLKTCLSILLPWFLCGIMALHSAGCLTTTPTPPPPAPPGPGPTPPAPPAPIPLPGLRVLIVYETADLSKYPKDQLAALYAKSVRDYLATKTVKNGYRFYDQNTDVSKDDPAWQTGMARPRTALPWILISDGKTGFEGPLPATTDDTLALLKKFGG